jgi:hypothetical protein
MNSGDEWDYFNELEDCETYNWANKATFQTTSDEGKAILASPNGRGAALLLTTHKSTFGQRAFIWQINIWCENDELNWLFNVRTGTSSGAEGDTLDDLLGDVPP